MERKEEAEKWLEKLGSKLNDYAVPIPAGSWDQMQGRLEMTIIRQKSDRVRALKRWMGVAATLLIAVSSIFFLSKKEPSVQQMKVQHASFISLAIKALNFPNDRVELFHNHDAQFSVAATPSESAQVYVEHDNQRAIYRWRNGQPQLVVQHGFSKAQLSSFVHLLVEKQTQVLEALNLQ